MSTNTASVERKRGFEGAALLLRKFRKMKANVKSPNIPVVAKSSKTYEEEKAKVRFQKESVLNAGDTYLVKSVENVPYPLPSSNDWASLWGTS